MTASNMVVSGNIDFSQARFGKDAYFGGSTLAGDVSLFQSSFVGRAYFEGVLFAASAPDTVSFQDCSMKEPATFYGAKFVNQYPNFGGAILHDKTAFTDQSENWPKGHQSGGARAKATCAVIRHNLGKQGLPEAEHFFYRREMGFAGQIGGWRQRLPYRVFGFFSDYGYSIVKPFWWLVGVWVSVSMINHVVLQWGASMGTIEGYHPIQAFGLSFANLFPIFGLHKLWFTNDFLTGLNGWLKFLGGVETVVSLPLLFFLGLGLRTRFRLR